MRRVAVCLGLILAASSFGARSEEKTAFEELRGLPNIPTTSAVRRGAYLSSQTSSIRQLL